MAAGKVPTRAGQGGTSLPHLLPRLRPRSTSLYMWRPTTARPPAPSAASIPQGDQCLVYLTQGGPLRLSRQSSPATCLRAADELQLREREERALQRTRPRKLSDTISR